MYDDMPGCTWIIGIIEENSGDIIIKMVKDHKIPTITKIISEHVKIGSLVITDEYSLYPSAIKDSMCKHEKVNHSKGFKIKKDIILITLKIYGRNLNIKKNGN
ncbi:hypothetical protein DMUE_0414 [Dictyocoela muelleri]|nr:hypothetical protein DMUE_0414 [Dictyocoela muelleri]